MSKSLGDRGEQLAIERMQKDGYEIIDKNFRTKFGEIDIIARDADVWVFVEVKTRTSQEFGLPQEAVGFRKQNKIVNGALKYINEKKLGDISWRVDVVSILMNRDGKVRKFEIIKNAVVR